MNISTKIGAMLLTTSLFWSCNKVEPLQLDTEYAKQSAERSKVLAEQEAQKQAEAEGEAQKKWDSYYEMLTEYKQKSWKGEKPFTYMFFAGWAAVEGLNQTWLQAIPDSVTAVSIWGGLAKEPSELTENQIIDLEMFHKKGGTVFTCYQVSQVGQGLPGGADAFNQKYGREETADAETKRSQIYARELARHIIALNLDGFDIDWEPSVGNHGRGYAEFTNGNGAHRETANMISFFTELGKYFGAKYEGDERKQYLRDLFDETKPEYHENEKEFIRKYKPYFEKLNAVDKKFYLLFDGQFFPMTQELDKYFDKYVMQDYGRVDTFDRYLSQWTHGSGRNYTPPATRVASTSEFEKGQYPSLIDKAKAYKIRNGGVAAYKGEKDYGTTSKDIGFTNYMINNKVSRNYKNYAWFREAIRIMDPRAAHEYAGYKDELVIKTAKN